jgi:undecaprenyl-diphosphatase
MAPGLFRGVERPTAARFSFLLSTPVILGAGLFPLLDLFGSASPGTQMPALLVGFVAAAASGYACIWFLLRYLRQGKLYPFAIYCALMGSVCLVAGALL